MTPREFLAAHVGTPHSDNDPCVIWPYCQNQEGYGMVWFENGSRFASTALLKLRDGAPPAPGMVARHGVCHNRLCIIHVAWGTESDNGGPDRLRDATHYRGERNPSSKLNLAQVHQIRTRRSAGSTTRLLAAEFGVSQQQVSDICTGKSWGWLDEHTAIHGMWCHTCHCGIESGDRYHDDGTAITCTECGPVGAS